MRKATDWWAGGILIPEYWHLNKGTQGGNTPHKADISATYELPFGRRPTVCQQRWCAQRSCWRMADERVLHRLLGHAVHYLGSNASLNANSRQRADQVKDRSRDSGGIGRTATYFDPTAFRPVTEARFGTAGFNTMRGPGYANLDLSVFRSFRLSRSMNLQLRLEIFNLTNTPHFAEPGGTNIQNVVFNADGSISVAQRVRLNHRHQQRRSRVRRALHEDRSAVELLIGLTDSFRLQAPGFGPEMVVTPPA